MIQEIAAADRRRLDEMSAVAQEVLDAQQELARDKEALEQVKLELEDAQAVLDDKQAQVEQVLAELVNVAEDLDALYEQFEAEQDAFLEETHGKLRRIFTGHNDERFCAVREQGQRPGYTAQGLQRFVITFAFNRIRNMGTTILATQ